MKECYDCYNKQYRLITCEKCGHKFCQKCVYHISGIFLCKSCADIEVHYDQKTKNTSLYAMD